jgi:hypothetical protein
MADLIATTVDGGGTGDYLTLNAAEADNFGATSANLVSEDEYCVCSCICTNGTADSTAVTIVGQTTDASHTITITVPQAYRHPGYWVDSGNVYRINCSATPVIGWTTSNVVYAGLAVNCTSTAAGAVCYDSLSSAASTNVLMDACIGIVSAAAASTAAYGVYGPEHASSTLLVKNSIFIGGGTSVNEYGVRHTAGALTAHNVTVCKFKSYGIRESASGFVVQNCLSFGNGGDYLGTFSALSAKNGYSNGSGPGGGSNAINLGTDSAVVFKDYAGNDFHLRCVGGVVNPAFRTGADLDEDATLPVTLDIDGETRHATTPCIGADEAHDFAAAGAALLADIFGSGDTEREIVTTGAATIAAITASGRAVFGPAATGAAAIPAVTAAGTVNRSYAAAGAATLAPITASGPTEREVVATGAATLASITASGTTEREVVASGAATLAAITASGVANRSYSATGAATLAPVTASGYVGLDYYVDATGGSDSNSGHQTGAAWKTIAKVNAIALQPGDAVYLKRGALWREMLTVPGSGILGSPITFTAYGEGANPQLIASDLISVWLDGGGNIWSATVTTSPAQVFFDRARGNKKTELISVTVAGDWYWADNVLYTYCVGDPSTYHSNNGVEASSRARAIAIQGKAYIVVSSIDVMHANGDGNITSWGVGGTNITISNLTTSYSASQGVNWLSTNVTISNVVAHHNGLSSQHHGFYPSHDDNTEASGFLIENSEASYSSGFGFHLYQCGGGTVRSCHGHNNSKAGLIVDSLIANEEVNVYYSIFNENATEGIKTTALGSGCKMAVLNCVSYGNAAEGMLTFVNNSATSITIKNCIFCLNGAEQFRHHDSPSPYTLDYNAFYKASGNIIRWCGTSYTTAQFAAYKLASGQDSHSIVVDPLFVNAASANFRLLPTSPCIDVGVDVGLTEDFVGVELPQFEGFDIGAYEIMCFGAATVPTITASGTTEREVVAYGAATVPTITAQGATEREVVAAGAAFLAAIEAIGTVNRSYAASGAATFPTIRAGGGTEREVVASGAATLSAITAFGKVSIEAGGVKPISDRIIENLVDTLEDVTETAGYNRTLRTVTDKLTIPTSALRDIAFVAGVREAKKYASCNNVVQSTMTVLINVVVEEGDDLTLAVRQAAADVEKILHVDPKRGALACDTKIVSVEYETFSDNEPLGSCTLEVEILYRHRANDPYTVV